MSESEIKEMMKNHPEFIRSEELDWSRKNPCGDCPFLNTSPYHGGVASGLKACVEAIKAGNFVHTCHKTDNRPNCDGPRNWKGKIQHCTGAIMMLLRTGKGMDLQLPLMKAAEQGKIDLADMTKRARASKFVFTVPGLIAFYAEEVSIRVKRMKLKRKGRPCKPSGL
jgi:hypothetical protein